MRIGLTISGIASLTAFGGAVIFVLVSSAYRSAKHALYYSKVDAIVQTAGTGCSVRGPDRIHTFDDREVSGTGG